MALRYVIVCDACEAHSEVQDDTDARAPWLEFQRRHHLYQLCPSCAQRPAVEVLGGAPYRCGELVIARFRREHGDAEYLVTVTESSPHGGYYVSGEHMAGHVEAADILRRATNAERLRAAKGAS